MPFARRNPGFEAAQRTIREAFEDLEKTISPADSKDFEAATLQSVQKAALDIESQLGMRSSLRNMRRLMPLFSGLEHYSAAMDTLCNGTLYLPWLWAPIKLILRVASEYVEAFEQIVKAYSRIGEALTRFQVLGLTFSQNTNFHQTLAVFYTDILRLHKQAYKFVRRSCWKVLFLTSWGRFQRRFDNIIDDLKKHEEQIDKEANAYHIAEAKETRKNLESWRLDALAKLAQDEGEQTANHLQIISTWLKLDETDQLAIFDKISAEGAKYTETCAWILKNPTMVSWLRTWAETPFVWLQGNPGTGKSVIVGQLVKFLRASPNSLVVTHFCTYSYASSTQYDKILRSLLFQLVHANDDLIAHLHWEYVVGKKIASISTLEQLLTTVITALLGEPGQNQVIHVFLDGLDEFEAEKQRQIINLMRKIANGARARGVIFKVLMSCRASPLLEKLLRKSPVVSLSDEKERLEGAIWTYANQRLRAHAHRLSQLGLGGSDLTDMARSIAVKADGMFLWARLVLDYLAANIFYSRQEITAAINTLPRKLSEFYERILTNIIANFDARSVDRMRQILGWIAFAKRPLRKIEFRSALSFSAGDSMVDEPVPSYIFDICAPLIEQRRDSSFAFIHVSVKDYLQTSESKILLTADNVMREHGITSITCLLSGLDIFQSDYSQSSRSLRVLKGLHGFHVYANEFWVDYVLSLIASYDTFNQYPLLSMVFNNFSEKLDNLSEFSDAFNVEEISRSSETNLNLLKGYKGLYANAKAALEARSKKASRDETELGGSAADLKQVNELRDILVNYQATIKSLLLIHEFPGVTAEELELFKREFRTSAYTCSFPLCPRATAGFETNELRLEHEENHNPRLRCLYTGCQYPSFISARALKNHEIKYHETVQGRKTIRREAAWPQRDLQGSGQMERTENESSENFARGTLSHQGIQEAPGYLQLFSTLQNQNQTLQATTSPLPIGRIGQVDAPPPPGPNQPPLVPPPPPSWLTSGLADLLTEYPRDRFEGVVRYTAIKIDNEQPVPVPAPGQSTEGIKWLYLPRILCHDCPGKLYVPGPDTTVGNFEIHLKDRRHRERVEARIAPTRIQPPYADPQTHDTIKNGMNAQSQSFYQQVSQAQTPPPISRSSTPDSHSSLWVNYYGTMATRNLIPIMGGGPSPIGGPILDDLISQRNEEGYARVLRMLESTSAFQIQQLTAEQVIQSPPDDDMKCALFEATDEKRQIGIGHCMVVFISDLYSGEEGQVPHLIVKVEGLSILGTIIEKKAKLQKANDHLITWFFPGDNSTMALSFNHPESCAAVWEFIVDYLQHR